MLIPSWVRESHTSLTSLSRRVNANSQHDIRNTVLNGKLIKKGEC